MNPFNVIILILLTSCLAIQAAQYTLTSNDLIGKTQKVIIQKSDTWHHLAIQHEISIQDLKHANPHLTHPNQIKAKSQLILPKQYILPPKAYRNGIVINMPEQRLYFFPKNDQSKVYTYPVAMGRSGWQTPTGPTKVISKTKDPTWFIPESIREYTLDQKGRMLPELIPAGPDNPLGTRAIYLKFKNILIHGTNNESSIGKLVSSGCIRMYNHHVEALFAQVEPGTPVIILNHPIKAGQKDNELYLEIHPPVPTEELELNDYNHSNILQSIEDYHLDLSDMIDWDKARIMQQRPTGIPTPISQPIQDKLTQPVIDNIVTKKAADSIQVTSLTEQDDIE